MRQGNRQSVWARVLVALLTLDLLLGLVFGFLLVRRPAPRASGPPVAAATQAGGAAATAPAPVATTGAATAVSATAPIPTAPPQAGTAATPRRAAGLPPNPLVSRGKPAFASPGVAAPGAVDGRYCTEPGWRASTFPSWLAVQVGAGPSKLLLSWNSDEPTNYTGDDDEPAAGIPTGYTIETSADSTNGADGTWQAAATVRDNAARTRAHSFAFAGASWVRMTVRAGVAGAPLAIDEIDIHDISQGAADTVFFMGDSITAAAFLRCDRLQPSYAALVHDAYPDYFPAQIDGGVAGVSADYGAERIGRWLEANTDYQVWALAFGTNDAYRERPSEVFERQLQTMIDAIKADGKEPVLARIPHTTNADKDKHVQRLNGVIDRLAARNGLKAGPDLYGWFRDHPEQLASDGIHPTVAGSVAINRLWFEALRPRYTGQGASGPRPGATSAAHVALARRALSLPRRHARAVLGG